MRPVAGFQKKKTERKKKRACSRPPVLLRGGGRGRACCPPTGPRHGRVRIGGRGSARRGTGTLLWTGAPSRSPRGCRRATPSPRERTPRTAVGSGRQQRREWRRLATRARDPPPPPPSPTDAPPADGACAAADWCRTAAASHSAPRIFFSLFFLFCSIPFVPHASPVLLFFCLKYSSPRVHPPFSPDPETLLAFPLPLPPPLLFFFASVLAWTGPTWQTAAGAPGSLSLSAPRTRRWRGRAARPPRRGAAAAVALAVVGLGGRAWRRRTLTASPRRPRCRLRRRRRRRRSLGRLMSQRYGIVGGWGGWGNRGGAGEVGNGGGGMGGGEVAAGARGSPGHVLPTSTGGPVARLYCAEGAWVAGVSEGKARECGDTSKGAAPFS